MNGEENTYSQPVYHVFGPADPDTFCMILDPIVGYDVSKLGVFGNKDWHYVFQITPYEQADVIGSPDLVSSYEDWEIYRDILYDAVDYYIYECKRIASGQPYDAEDANLLYNQLCYNRDILMKTLDYMDKEMGCLQNDCAFDSDMYDDWGELKEFASREYRAVRNESIIVPTPLLTIDFDFIF